MALREACSPSNMTAAPDELDVLTKTDVDGVVRRKVDAKPDPPCVEILDDTSKVKARRSAGSTDDESISCSGNCANLL